jgi:hypothetical protein
MNNRRIQRTLFVKMSVHRLFPWLTLPPLRHALIGGICALPVSAHPLSVERALGVIIAATTVAWYRSRRPQFPDFVTAVFTGEYHGTWWSSTHYIILLKNAPPRSGS